MRDQSLNGGLAGVAAKEASHFAEGRLSDRLTASDTVGAQ